MHDPVPAPDGRPPRRGRQALLIAFGALAVWASIGLGLAMAFNAVAR